MPLKFKTKKAALNSAAPWAWLITGILQFHFSCEIRFIRYLLLGGFF